MRTRRPREIPPSTVTGINIDSYLPLNGGNIYKMKVIGIAPTAYTAVLISGLYHSILSPPTPTTPRPRSIYPGVLPSPKIYLEARRTAKQDMKIEISSAIFVYLACAVRAAL